MQAAAGCCTLLCIPFTCKRLEADDRAAKSPVRAILHASGAVLHTLLATLNRWEGLCGKTSREPRACCKASMQLASGQGRIVLEDHLEAACRALHSVVVHTRCELVSRAACMLSRVVA